MVRHPLVVDSTRDKYMLATLATARIRPEPGQNARLPFAVDHHPTPLWALPVMWTVVAPGVAIFQKMNQTKRTVD